MLATVAGLAGFGLSLSWATGAAVSLAGAGGALASGAIVLWLARHRQEQQAEEQKRMEERLRETVAALNQRILRARDGLRQTHELLVKESSGLVQRAEAATGQTSVLDQATGQMSSWIHDVGGSIEQLSSSTEETSSSVFEMVATIEEIAHHIEGVASAVNETAGATTELVNTIKGIDGNVEQLAKFVAETSGTMEQVTAAIRQVESRTVDSDELSQQVAANADEGMSAVQLTIEGMSRIRSSVHEAAGAITQLGRRSEEIGGILNVIDDVAEQTNLLALNAAIIAAQAGEHGKGFAVVADEIRGLAERTGSSTREIGALIGFFQEEAARARQGMESGSRQVDEGAALAEKAGKALTKILDSARESSRMAGDIAQTTQEQVQGTHIVVEAVSRVNDMVSQLSAITTEQTVQSESILATVARMRELTEQVKRATLEQAKGGSLISEAIRTVTENVASIHQATLRQDTESDRMATALTVLRNAGEESLVSARRVSEADRTMVELIDAMEEKRNSSPRP